MGTGGQIPALSSQNLCNSSYFSIAIAIMKQISQTTKSSLQNLILTSETINIYIQWDHSLYGTSAGGRLFWACSVMFILSTPLVCLLHLTVNQTLNIFIVILNLSCQPAMQAGNMGNYHASGLRKRLPCQWIQCQQVTQAITMSASYVGNYHGKQKDDLKNFVPEGHPILSSFHAAGYMCCTMLDFIGQVLLDAH